MRNSIVSIIAAVAENRVIGRGKSLPWRLPEDMRHFKQTTMGKPVIMGRKTFQTLKKPLAGRKNIVLTRNTQFTATDITVCHSLEEAFRAAGEAEEIIVAGGETIYREALPYSDRMYLTHIHAAFEGDTYFPEFDEKSWKVLKEEQHEKNDHPLAFTIVTYQRTDNYK